MWDTSTEGRPQSWDYKTSGILHSVLTPQSCNRATPDILSDSVVRDSQSVVPVSCEYAEHMNTSSLPPRAHVAPPHHGSFRCGGGLWTFNMRSVEHMYFSFCCEATPLLDPAPSPLTLNSMHEPMVSSYEAAQVVASGSCTVGRNVSSACGRNHHGRIT